MTLDQARELLISGNFHHATYRNHGTLWEGLHFYRGDPDGFRGYFHVGMIHRDEPDLERAHRLIQSTGYSVGAYGHG